MAQESIGPVNQGLQGALARHGFGRPLIQPGEALAQPFGDRFDGQRAGLRGGDFDRQGDTVELLADTGDRQNIRLGQREMQQRLCGAVGEQLNRVKAQRVRNRESFRAIDGRGGQWFQPDHVLLGQVQRDAARRQDRQPRGLAAERLDEARARFHQVFAIIQHQEHGLVAQVIHNGAGRRATDVGRQTHGPCDRIVHRAFISNARQFDQADVMGKNAGHALGNLDRQARLADAAGSGQGHQPDRSARQKINQARGFWLAPKKARQHGR